MNESRQSPKNPVLLSVTLIFSLKLVAKNILMSGEGLQELIAGHYWETQQYERPQTQHTTTGKWRDRPSLTRKGPPAGAENSVCHFKCQY